MVERVVGARFVRLVLALIALCGADFAATESRALDLTRSLSQLRHTAWTARQGVPTDVGSFAQTPDGWLWIGASSGLYRFDGVHVVPFAQKLPGGAVLSLAVTPSGDLWIGTSDGVSRLSGGRLTTFEVPGLGDGVRSIALGPKGEVWVATDKVARFDGRTWQVMGSNWGTSERYRKPGGVWGLAVGRDGTVWSKNLLGLYFLRPGEARFTKAEGYAGSIINFAKAPDGRVWTADSASLRFYALPDLGPTGPPPAPQFGASVPPGLLGRVIFDRDGALWAVNSVTGGFFRVRSVMASPGQAEIFTPAEGLTGGVPSAVFEDREGDIWVGTPLGVNRFSPANIVTEAGISIRGFGADITATPDAVYVTDGFPPPAPATGHPIQTMYEITDGAPRPVAFDIGTVRMINGQGADALLVGGAEALVRVRQGKAERISLPEGFGATELVSVAQHGDDIWGVFEAHGLYLRHAGAWAKVAAPGVNMADSTRLRVDQAGAVWLFDSTSVRRLTGDHLDVFGPQISGGVAFSPGAKGVIFTGPQDINWFDGAGVHTLSPGQAPFAGARGVVSDDAGGTWFHSGAGIYRVARRQLEAAFGDPRARLDYQLFDERDGLQSTATLNQFGGSAVRGPDGRLWFLNADNLAWIDPHHLYRNTVSPPVEIKTLTVAGKVFDAAQAHKLAAGTSNLQIDYTGISLQNPDRVRFRYRLEGVDKGWVEAGDRRQAFYTRLGPGQYRFRVIAANADGVWNATGATQAFEIPPTFFQSVWFLLLCAVAAGIALWLLFSLRMRQVTAALQSRHEERMAERERIARELHDTLLQGVQGLILRFQAVMEDLPHGPPRREMDAALERADEVLISGRDQVRHIRAVSAAGDLGEALTRAAEDVQDRSKARFQLVVEGAPRALHPVVAEELAAIGREAILNAARHSGGQRIDANLVYERRGLTLSVVDDGEGVDAQVLAAGGRSGHFGLLGMRERAERVGAKLTLSSRPGAGARIEVFVAAHLAFASPTRDAGLRGKLRRALNRLAWSPGSSD